MASEHTVADDIVYDLISVQYHAPSRAPRSTTASCPTPIRVSTKTSPSSSANASAKTSIVPYAHTNFSASSRAVASVDTALGVTGRRPR